METGLCAWCETPFLCEVESPERAFIGEPLIGLVVEDEAAQSLSQRGFQVSAAGCERPQVVGAGQRGQKLQNLATAVTRDGQEIGGCQDRAADKNQAGEALQGAVNGLVGAVVLLRAE
ncbi:hypothetical protein [Streptomyces sp. NPDC057403]|uniref:hypothetical protein n=1 Tax=Streptomyces sp. NPDC057403 TaxID=3346119 RepID=UPI0036A7CE53